MKRVNLFISSIGEAYTPRVTYEYDPIMRYCQSKYHLIMLRCRLRSPKFPLYQFLLGLYLLVWYT
jgi:hypothetical protein